MEIEDKIVVFIKLENTRDLKELRDALEKVPPKFYTDSIEEIVETLSLRIEELGGC